MAYDAARGQVILVATFSGSLQTWQWDGNVWTQRVPANSPSPRSAHAVAYDATRGRVVLYGGLVNGFSIWLRDTWEWDGTNWVQRVPLTSPPPTAAHAMAPDATGAGIILFGGATGLYSGSSETWRWDGTGWAQPLGQSPSARGGHALVEDVSRGCTVLFGGGRPESVFLSDTWEWDGVRWTQRTPASRPSARAGHAMTYDAARSRIVLVGGTAGPSHADTWEWDGSNWTQRNVTNNPPSRWGHAIAYAAERRRVVLFGGFPTSADTWEWDGVDWTQRFPANNPAARSGHTLAYHAARRRIVLFGGQSAGPPYIPLGDTWEWDGNDWSRSGGSPTDPPPRVEHAMTYDAARARLVLFGGGDNRGFSSETWEWDGTWTMRVPFSTPTPRADAALAYDTARAKVVMFGGGDSVPLSDVWEYSPVTPATYDVFGAGCVGSSGTPRLSGTAPYLGLPMSHEINGLRSGQPGVLVFGDSDRMWGPILLPHDLASLGMPGCTLYVSGENLIPLSTGTGTTRLTYTIPALAALEGLRCFNQYLSLDPAANPLGITASNAGIGVCRWP